MDTTQNTGVFESLSWDETTNAGLAWMACDGVKEIKSGCGMEVREGQSAVFISEGQMLDVLGAGRYALGIENLPILAKTKGLVAGATIKAIVFFVNMRDFTNLHWKKAVVAQLGGGKTANADVDGIFAFRIIDAVKFLTALGVGSQPINNQQVIDFFKNKIETEFEGVFKGLASDVKLLEAPTGLLEGVLKNLRPQFIEVGVALLSVEIPTEMPKENTAGGGGNVSPQPKEQPKVVENKVDTKPETPQPKQTFGLFEMMQQSMQTNAGMIMQNLGGNTPKPQNQQSKPEAKENIDVAKLLKDLAQLKKDGIITEEEFQQEKTELLSKM